MSNGFVVEQGTHDELIDANGAYARLVRAQDLGHADRDEGIDGGHQEAKVSLVRTQTQVGSIHGEASKEKGKDEINYSLIRCILIVLREQGGLWPWFLLLAIAAVLGGKFPSRSTKTSCSH